MRHCSPLEGNLASSDMIFLGAISVTGYGLEVVFRVGDGWDYRATRGVLRRKRKRAGARV